MLLLRIWARSHVGVLIKPYHGDPWVSQSLYHGKDGRHISLLVRANCRMRIGHSTAMQETDSGVLYMRYIVVVLAHVAMQYLV